MPNKHFGIALMFVAIVLPFFLPWLDRNPVRSSRYRPVYRIMIIIMSLTFLTLAWVGEQPPLPRYFLIERLGAAIYIGFYVLLPIISSIEPTKAVPDRVGT